MFLLYRKQVNLKVAATPVGDVWSRLEARSEFAGFKSLDSSGPRSLASRLGPPRLTNSGGDLRDRLKSKASGRGSRRIPRLTIEVNQDISD